MCVDYNKDAPDKCVQRGQAEMAAARDDECRVLRDANVIQRAANKCAWLLRRAESLLSRAKERLTAHADGLLSSAKERLTACADSLHTRAKERQTTHVDGLLSSARQVAMSAERCARQGCARKFPIEQMCQKRTSRDGCRELLVQAHSVFSQEQKSSSRSTLTVFAQAKTVFSLLQKRCSRSKLTVFTQG